MKKFITHFLSALIGILFFLGFGNTSFAQENSDKMTEAYTGRLVRITPKLADIDKTSMYGQPLVITRNENGVIINGSNDFANNKRATKKALEERLMRAASGYNSEIIQPPLNPALNIPTTSIIANFDGQTSSGLSPSDNNIAVGPTHVVHTVNHSSGTSITIYNKSGGVVAGPIIFSTITGFAGAGDPVVIYDQLANRWLICEFGPSAPMHNLNIAVSTTGDPTGSWAIYQYTDLTFFIDYHKLSVWHNAYYATSNDFNNAGTAYLGSSVYSMERSAMIAGAPTAVIIRTRLVDGPGNHYNMGTIGLEGMTTSTQNGLFCYPVPPTTLNVFEVTPNFGAGTQVVGPNTALTVNAFAAPPANVAQQGTGVGINTLGYRMMFKLNYRNNSGIESIVMTHTINNGGLAAARWYELRRVASVWTVFQQGTVTGADGNSRFMGGISMDGCGNIALMYSYSGTSAFPGIRYTGRNASDPLNTMTLPEASILNGTVAHTSNSRWGDYNTTVQDYSGPGVPNNGSFWSTAQYANGLSFSQKSRVANFTLTGGCAPAATLVPNGYSLVAESCAPANGVIDPGETVTVSFCIQNVGTSATTNAVGTLQASGGVILPSGPQNYGVIGIGGTVCRNFSFTNNSSTCGATITASIQVQDGATNYGTMTYSIPLGTTTTLTSQNFDAVAAPALPAGWTTAVGGSGVAWVTSTAGTPAPPFVSAPNAAFTTNPSSPAESSLQSASFTPGAGASATFQGNYAFESGGWDGGVLEISINAGPWVDIITAGGSFTAGGYSGTINSGTLNPLQGRAGWINSSGAFVTTTVNLPLSSVGQPTRLRWRMGSDDIIGGQGWRVDNFVINQPSCCGAVCVITCPPNMTVATPANATQCGMIVNYPPATTTGLCGPLIYSNPSGSFFPVGVTTVTVTSGSGGFCSFTITVTDGTPPLVSCPANITVNNAPGTCGAVVNYTVPTATDNCQSGVIVQLPASFANHGSGGVFTLQGNNAAGGVFFTITNTSVESRTIQGFGVRFGNPAFGAVPAPQTLTVWSRTGALTAAIENSTAGWTNQGPQVVNPIPPYFATGTGPLGFCGLNTPVVMAPGSVYSFYIHGANACPVFNGTVGAITPPVSNSGFTLAGGTVSYTPLGGATHFQQGITNGIININVQYKLGQATTRTAGLASGSVFPVGVTTNTYQATDASGNVGSCSFTVTVVDNEQPVFTSCPANVVRTTDVDQCYATYTPPQPTFTDNCAVTRLTWSITQPTGFPTLTSPPTGINYVPSTQFRLLGRTGQGVSTITYTAADAAGNTRTCTFTVTVNDGQIPTIVTPPVTKFVCVGSNGVFSIVVTTNGGPLTHTWQEWNGTTWVNIPGSNSPTLTIPNVSFLDNTRTFRDSLTGRCTDVISNTATLYVNPLPTVSLSTNIPPQLVPGQVLTINSTVNPAGGTYQWYRNGVLLTSPNQQLPSLSGLTVDDIGTYRLTYTDLNGCVRTSNDLVISGQSSTALWVYPVPNNGTFQVRFFNQAGEGATVRVFDAKGSKIYERAVVTGITYTRIDVNLGPAIADGTYIVELVNSAGKRVGVKKIIVRQKP